MKLDCCNLACPEPVLQTKKALENLPENAILEILVNSTASKENVIRFVQNAGYELRSEEQEDGKTLIIVLKGFACSVAKEEQEDLFLNKVLFLKSDQVGEGELGSRLVVGFLKSLLELPKLPRRIACVNRADILPQRMKMHLWLRF